MDRRGRPRWDSSAGLALGGSQAVTPVRHHRRARVSAPDEAPVVLVRYGREPAQASEDKLSRAGRGSTRRPIPQSVVNEVEKLATEEFKMGKRALRMSNAASAAQLLRRPGVHGAPDWRPGVNRAPDGSETARSMWSAVQANVRTSLLMARVIASPQVQEDRLDLPRLEGNLSSPRVAALRSLVGTLPGLPRSRDTAAGRGGPGRVGSERGPPPPVAEPPAAPLTTPRVGLARRRRTRRPPRDARGLRA